MELESGVECELESQLSPNVDTATTFTCDFGFVAVSGRFVDMASTELWVARDAFRTAKSSDFFSDASVVAQTVFRRFETLPNFDGILGDGVERNSAKLS